MFQSALILFIILFVVQALSAGPEVVYKESRPEKALESEGQAGLTKEETKKEKQERYVYNPAGKTDPFESFIVKAETGRGGAKSVSARDSELQGGEEIISKGEPETELEKIEISNLSLTAVIKGKNKNWAMVIDSKGKGYFLEKGTKIGIHSGVVDEIICEERKTDFGMEIIRKVIIKVPYRDRDRKIIYRTIEMEMPFKAS